MQINFFILYQARRILKTLPSEYVLLLKGIKSQERLGNIAITLLRFFDHFKPRKVSINDGGSKVIDFYTAK